MKKKRESIREIANSMSLIPLILSKTGKPDEEPLEVILCSSMSGGKQYHNNMPKELTLVRILADKTEYTMKYIQKEEL